LQALNRDLNDQYKRAVTAMLPPEEVARRIAELGEALKNGGEWEARGDDVDKALEKLHHLLKGVVGQWLSLFIM